MNNILDFLVDNYIWVLIICVVLILILIGYIFDQKRKLDKKKQSDIPKATEGNTININTPVQDEVKVSNTENLQSVSNNMEQPIVNEPVMQTIPNTPVVEEPTFNTMPNNINTSIPDVEPMNNMIHANEIPTEMPLESQTIETPNIEMPNVNPLDGIKTEMNVDNTQNSINQPINEPVEMVMPNVIEEPVISNTIETPQIIEDVTPVSNVQDINNVIQESSIQDITPVEEIKVDNIETIEDIPADIPNDNSEIVNMWEPEMVNEPKDIVNNNPTNV